MKAVSISDIKQELQTLDAKETARLCSRLARHKKENKELLTYLLFNAQNVEACTAELKEDVTGLFNEVNKVKLFFCQENPAKNIKAYQPAGKDYAAQTN